MVPSNPASYSTFSWKIPLFSFKSLHGRRYHAHGTSPESDHKHGCWVLKALLTSSVFHDYSSRQHRQAFATFEIFTGRVDLKSNLFFQRLSWPELCWHTLKLIGFMHQGRSKTSNLSWHLCRLIRLMILPRQNPLGHSGGSLNTDGNIVS